MNPRTSEFIASDGRVITSKAEAGADQAWCFEPVILPTMYWISNSAPNLRSLVLEHQLGGDTEDVLLAARRHFALNQLWVFDSLSNSDQVAVRNAFFDTTTLGLAAPNWLTLVNRPLNGELGNQWQIHHLEDTTSASIPNQSYFSILIYHFSVNLTNEHTGMLVTALQVRPTDTVTLNILRVDTKETRDLTRARWSLRPFPLPPSFWVTIQNAGTGMFLSQERDKSIVASTGPRFATDYSVQWRFIVVDQDAKVDRSPRYAIVNRATGLALDHWYQRTDGLSVAAKNADRTHANYLWYLDIQNVEEGFVGIVNNNSHCALDHFRGKSIQAYKPRPAEDIHRQWTIIPVCSFCIRLIGILTNPFVQCHDSLPSFAIVSAQTGRCISEDPSQIAETVVTADFTNKSESQ